MTNNTEGMLTASKVANALDISPKTLNNWYKWYFDSAIEKPENFPHLPEYIQLHMNGPRYWTNEDVEKLRIFQSWLPKGRAGVMGAVSCKYRNVKKGNKCNEC